MAEFLKNSEIFKKKFNKLKEGGLSREEKEQLKKLFLQLPRTRQEEILNEYKNLNEPQKSFFEELRRNLDGLKQDVEKQNNFTGGFEELKNSFENNEAIKEVFDIFENYLDLKLDKNFSKEQKNEIKLALFGILEKKLNFSGMVEITIEKILKPIKEIIENLNLNDKDNKRGVSIKDLEDLDKKFNKTFEKFGISNITDFLNEKIEKINKNKKYETFDDLIGLFDEKQRGKIDKNTIKQETIKLDQKLKSGRNMGENIKTSVENLPFGKDILGFIKGLAKQYPILGFLFSIFFGNDFLNDSLDKRKNSIENLKKYVEDDDFSLKENIKKEDLENFDLKNLEDFYKYLDNKEIDYTKEDFWKKLLNGSDKKEDEKINEIHKLLKNKDGKILGKNDRIKELVEKLNNLEKVESNKKVKQNDEEIKKAEIKLAEIRALKKGGSEDNNNINIEKGSDNIEKNNIGNANETSRNTDSKKDNSNIVSEKKNDKKVDNKEKKDEVDLKKQKVISEEEKKLQEIINQKKFENSVMNISKLPSEIFYKGEKLILNIKNNQIVLGKDKYNISIKALGSERFEKIEFKNGNFILNGNEDNSITKNQVIELIQKLKSGENFEYNGVTKKPFIGKVNYKLIISKV